MAIKKYHKSANLFDYHTMSVGMTGKYLTADGSVGVSVDWNTTDYIPVDSSVFTVGRLGGISPAICLYDENKNFIGGQAYKTGGIGFKEYTTVTAGSVAKFARFSYYAVSGNFYDDLSKIMLVEGSIPPTSYIPYVYIWSQIPYRKYGTETDTITTLPATIVGDGTPITSYTIKGNMEQNGTPTPNSPIYPSECGERTANLVYKTLIGTNIKSDGQIIVNSDFNLAIAKVVQGETYSISNGSGIMAFYIDEPVVGTPSIDHMRYDITPTVTIPQGANYIAFRYVTPETPMLNLGSTALPYEPYGYKLPLTLGSTTTDIYLGEVQSTRTIKKLVLDGTEDWVNVGVPIGNTTLYQLSVADLINVGNVAALDVVCTHFECGNYYGASTEGVQHSFFRLIFRSAETTLENWKTFLAQQYANGTPVTVWYVLANPTTGIVNEPLRKIGDYVDSVSGTNLATSGAVQEFDINTTLKPSEVDMTYHGWHEHDDTKFTT